MGLGSVLETPLHLDCHFSILPCRCLWLCALTERAWRSYKDPRRMQCVQRSCKTLTQTHPASHRQRTKRHKGLESFWWLIHNNMGDSTHIYCQIKSPNLSTGVFGFASQEEWNHRTFLKGSLEIKSLSKNNPKESTRRMALIVSSRNHDQIARETMRHMIWLICPKITIPHPISKYDTSKDYIYTL